MNKAEMENNIKVLEDDFVQVSDPDGDAIAAILLKAKGESRTWKEYAEETGISAPTLSRWANGKISRPMSVENMLRIIDKSAEESAANFFELARANGYLSKTEQKAIRDRVEVRKQRKGVMVTVKSLMSLIIKAGLVDRGCTTDATILDDNPGGLESLFESVPKYDFNLRTGYKDEEYDWMFFLMPQTAEDYATGKYSADKMICQIIRELSPIFMTDAWKPEMYKGTKISFGFIDRELHDLFYDYISKANLNNRFSVCMLNTDANKVEETCFKSNIYDNSESPFDLPPILSMSMMGDGIADEIMVNDFLYFESSEEDDE